MIKLSSLFQNYMVLQREKPVRIWGKTDTPQIIHVLLNGQLWGENIFISDAFSFELPAQPAMENASIQIVGETEQVFLTNVDFGEVWIAGGQSNMEFLLKYDAEGKRQIKATSDRHFRFYDVGKYSYEGEILESPKDNTGWDKWLSFEPVYAPYFSAVGCYFARKLRKELGVPVGIVGCNWGGTSASAWIDERYLEDPVLRIYVDEYREKCKDLDLMNYKIHYREYQALLQNPTFVRFNDKLLEGTLTILNYLPMLFLGPKMLKHIQQDGPYSPNRPGGLYQTMLQQIVGFSTRGVIWYQGESDEHHADIYHALFAEMIRCWRKAWCEEIPFLFVQLAPYESWLGGKQIAFPVIREKQEWVSKHVPNTYMASIMDVGNRKDIHPKNKRPVGERLALLALGKIYGQTLNCEAPEFERAEITDGEIVLDFLHSAQGLHVQGNTLSALELLIDNVVDRNWTTATDGSRLRIRCAKVKADSSVQILFAQTGYCKVNLYNSVGLPTKPFIWKMVKTQRTKPTG